MTLHLHQRHNPSGYCEGGKDMKRIYTTLAATGLMLGMLLPASGHAFAREAITVRIGKQAALTETGNAVTVTMKVRCGEGYEVLETLVYVVQDDHQSQFRSIPVTCDDKLRSVTIDIPAAEGDVFHRGEARVSGYILVYDPTTGTTVSASPTRAINIK
jgi:hypothetical protein